MTKITITRNTTELDVSEAQFEELKNAMLSRQPMHEIVLDDHTGVLVNTETGVTVKYEREHEERTVGQLKEALDKAKIEYDPKARKDDLVKLAADKGV